MNRYGMLAMDAWREHKPSEFAQIEDPMSHFEALGETIEDQIISMTDELLTRVRLSEDYLTRVGQMNATRLQAEELVLDEVVWSQMPTGEELEEDEDYESPYWTRPSWLDEQDMPTDRSHPLWAMYEDDQEGGFVEAHRKWLREMYAKDQAEEQEANQA